MDSPRARSGAQQERRPRGAASANSSKDSNPAKAGNAGSAAKRRGPARTSKAEAAGPASYLAIVAFVPVCLLAFTLLKVPVWSGLLYAAFSVLCFLVYAVDKAAALYGRRRISEKTLHLLALAGGWPGAILAQQWLRHKSSKRSFRRLFWCTAGLNVAAFIGLALWLAPFTVGTSH